MELYTSSLNRHCNSRKSAHNFFGSRSSITEQRIYLPPSDLFTWNSLTLTQWLSLESFEWLVEGNLFKLNKFIHACEERGPGVTAQSVGALPSPRLPGPRVSGRSNSQFISGCAMSRMCRLRPGHWLKEWERSWAPVLAKGLSRAREITLFGEILTGQRTHQLSLSTRLQSQFRDGHRNGHTLTGSLQKGLCGHWRSPKSFLQSSLFLRNLGQPDRTPRGHGHSASERTNSAPQNV